MDQSLNIVLVVLVVAALIALGGLAAYLSHKAKMARQAELAALAGELNMTFDPHERRDFDGNYQNFELFRRGHTKRAYNTMAGTFDITGRAFRAFMGDYRYSITTSNGKTTTTTTHRVSYLILHTPYDGLPTLVVQPEGFMDKIKGAVGFDDIDFESEEFSRKFHVTSSDKRFAYDVIHPRMMEFLMGDGGGGGGGGGGSSTIDLSRGAICVVDGKRRWSAYDFKVRIAFVQRFFELWPEHLLSQLDTHGRA